MAVMAGLIKLWRMSELQKNFVCGDLGGKTQDDEGMYNIYVA